MHYQKPENYLVFPPRTFIHKKNFHYCGDMAHIIETQEIGSFGSYKYTEHIDICPPFN